MFLAEKRYQIDNCLSPADLFPCKIIPSLSLPESLFSPTGMGKIGHHLRLQVHHLLPFPLPTPVFSHMEKLAEWERVYSLTKLQKQNHEKNTNHSCSCIAHAHFQMPNNF